MIVDVVLAMYRNEWIKALYELWPEGNLCATAGGRVKEHHNVCIVNRRVNQRPVCVCTREKVCAMCKYTYINHARFNDVRPAGPFYWICVYRVCTNIRKSFEHVFLHCHNKYFIHQNTVNISNSYSFTPNALAASWILIL